MTTFLLVSCSNKSSTSIVVVHGQGQKTITKTRNKDISQVSLPFRFINYVGNKYILVCAKNALIGCPEVVRQGF